MTEQTTSTGVLAAMKPGLVRDKPDVKADEV